MSRLGKRLINAAKSPETKPIRKYPESQCARRVSRRALRLTLSRWSRAPRSDLDRFRRALEAAGVEIHRRERWWTRCTPSEADKAEAVRTGAELFETPTAGGGGRKTG